MGVTTARLRERDVRGVLDLIGDAYDADDRQEFRSALLPGFRRLVSANYCSYNEIAGGTEVLASIVEPELPAWAALEWERHAGENPLLRRFLRTRDGRAMRFSDVVSAEELHGMPLFQRLYRPLGVEHQIAFVLPSTPQLTIAIALTRPRTDFDERDLHLLELARPHLIQAYRAAELRERLIGTIAGLRSGLEADGTAMVLLDADGSVRFASTAAVALIGESADQVLEEGRPPPPLLAGWLGREEQSGSVPTPGGEGAVLIRRLRSDGRTVLLLGDAGRVLSRESLRSLGLTSREAEVLYEIARGGEAGTIATALGIRPRTVAKHMQSVHAKLGVSNRAQAVATAWAAAPAT